MELEAKPNAANEDDDGAREVRQGEVVEEPGDGEVYSFRRSERPRSLKSAKSGTSRINLSAFALEYILRSVRSALLPLTPIRET